MIVRNATLAYDKKILFSDICFDLPSGHWMSLLGPSGIGKSSLLKMIAGLIPAEASITSHQQTPVSQQIAYMAQTDLLLPWLNVIDNATLCLKLRSHSRQKQNAILDRAHTLLEFVGLGNVSSLYPHQLSGGMRQRVALVRMLMEDKPIILMDEPFSALDAITRFKLQELAADLLKDKSVLFITHDPMEALRLADSIYIMQGYPATLKLVATLTTQTPRALSDPNLFNLQASLFDELTATTSKAA